jgi:ADP-heptose:LPS heptosyltransferase
MNFIRCPPASVLVIMLRRIGDVLLTTPAVRELRKALPGARIDFLAEPPCDQLLRGNPDVTEVLAYDPSPLGAVGWLARLRGRYDWVVDFMGTPRSAFLAYASGAPLRAGAAHVSHRWAYNRRIRQPGTPCYNPVEKIRLLKALGLAVSEEDPMPRLKVPEASLGFARRAADALGGDGPLIGLVPGSRRPSRRWPAGHYARLGRLLRERLGARVWVFWGPGEKALASEVAAGAGASIIPAAPGLMDLAGMLSLCALVVSNCNGPKHVAQAVGCATLALHGSSDPAVWNPSGRPRHRALRLDGLGCVGCGLNDCPRGLECLAGLSPDAVFEAAASLLEGR